MKIAGIATLVAGCVLAGASGALTAEPAAPAGKGAVEKTAVDPSVQKELYAALEKHIQTQTKENDGVFPLYDNDSEETFSLHLVRVGTEAPMKVLATTYIVRARFRSPGDPEFGEKDKDVLADFTLFHNGGKWEISEEIVYSVDGVARYTYTKDFKRILIAPASDAQEPEDGESAGPEESEERDAGQDREI